MPKSPKVQFQQNLISRVQENFKNINFGMKNVPFILFWAQQELSSKMGSVTFMCLLKTIFMQRYAKIGEKLGANPEKTVLQTSWLTDSCH